MRLQRACVGGNRAEMQFIKWTAEGTFKGIHTDEAEYYVTLRRA